MIHARDDYNRIQDPAGKIPEDEPVFLLRAQDQLACMAVAYYASLCEQAQSPEIAAKAREHADRMTAWPVKKVPDLPAQEATLSQGTRQAEQGEKVGIGYDDLVLAFCAKWSGNDKVEAGIVLDWLMRQPRVKLASPTHERAAPAPEAVQTCLYFLKSVIESPTTSWHPAQLEKARKALESAGIPVAPNNFSNPKG